MLRRPRLPGTSSLCLPRLSQPLAAGSRAQTGSLPMRYRDRYGPRLCALSDRGAFLNEASMEIGAKTNKINTREVRYDRVSGRWRLLSTVASPGGRATRRLALIVPLRRPLSIYRTVNGAVIVARSRTGRARGASGRARAPATDASIMRHPARHGASPVSGHLGRQTDAADRGALTGARRPLSQQPYLSGRQSGHFRRKKSCRTI